MIVDIHLHPLSWRVLIRDNSYDGVAVTITKSWQYKLFTSQLRRQNVINASDLRRDTDKTVVGKVYILSHEYERYGCHISPDRQALINDVLYNHERDFICALVMSAKASELMNRSQAFDYFLEKRGLDPTHLDKENIKKFYARNYRQLEDEYAIDLQSNKPKH